MSILDIKHLTYRYRNNAAIRDIFDDVSLFFEMGRFYILTGDSGSGKSTFLSVIGGLDERYEGEILFNRENIRSMGFDKYRKNYVSSIYQNYNLFPYLTALENIQAAVRITGKPKTQTDNVMSVFRSLGLSEDVTNRKVSSLSGGERQRVAVARSIVLDTDIVLADEATGSLDLKNGIEVVKLLKNLATEKGKCVILATHNIRYQTLADQVFMIDQTDRKIKTVRTLK